MTDKHLWFNRAGEPIELAEFTELCADLDYKRVALDQIGDQGSEDAMTVSTVWLGYNMALPWDDGPRIFETRIFGGKYDGEMWRYPAVEQAKHAHDVIVDSLRAGLELPV